MLGWADDWKVGLVHIQPAGNTHFVVCTEGWGSGGSLHLYNWVSLGRRKKYVER